MVSDDEKAACTWNLPCRLLLGVQQRQMKVQAAFKAWVWRRNAMNTVRVWFRCSKSSLHVCLRKPEKCGGGAFAVPVVQA